LECDLFFVSPFSQGFYFGQIRQHVTHLFLLFQKVQAKGRAAPSGISVIRSLTPAADLHGGSGPANLEKALNV
jgi:hypothetical protein